MKRQRIELTIKDMEDGAFAMSLVDQPAIEEETILLSKQEIQLQVINEEKRLIVGFALVPDKDIPRVIERDGKKVVFDIFFSKDTVKKTAHKFMMDMNLQEFTIHHKQPIEGVKVVESWVVEDPEKDKANHYGLKPKGGEWVLMSYVENDEVLERIKNGEVRGYSLEGRYEGLEQLKFRADENTILEELKGLIK